MRISTATILTLTTLAATEMSQAAIASPLINEGVEEPLAASHVIPSTAEATEVVAAIPAPDELAVPTFSTSEASSTPETASPTAALPELDALAPITSIAPPEIHPPEGTVARSLVSPNAASMPTEGSIASGAIAVTQSDPSQPIQVEPNADLDQIVPVAGGQPGASEENLDPNRSLSELNSTESRGENSLPSAQDIQDLQQQLRSLEVTDDRFGNEFEGSPAITISNPSGYGADNNTGFVNFSFQSRTRYGDVADGTAGIGIGLGDAERSVGLQLSYTIASFGGSRDFGSGGFNAKIHRQLPGGWSIAAGWEGFLTVGGGNDFEDSVYGSVTHVFATTPSLDQPLSRIALTAGVGSGRFRTEEAIADDEDTLGVFGSVAVRLARPVSAIVEWTGQDLAIGLSIAPIRNVPWVITPAVRDLAGAGDGARFVVGTGISFQF